MPGLLCILVASFFACFLLTPLARSVAARYGLVDHPDNRRKMHARPVPLAGGIAILVSVVAVLGAGLLLPGPLAADFAPHAAHFVGLLLAAMAICALGVLDDFQCLRGRHKLLGQVMAVGIVIGFGVQIRSIHLLGVDVELGMLAIPVTLLWLLGAINSLNLLDGMDGLLGSVGFIVTAAMAAMAVLGGQWAAAFVALALAGALLGFLCYNFPPASVFLGDAGSMLTGLVIGVLGIESSLKGPATVALVAPLAILTIPFLDTLAAIVRRKLTGRSIYETDRGHLHHCLLRRGLTARGALLLISLLCLVTGVGALASLALRNELIAIMATVVVIFILVATRLFGRAELELFAKRLVHFTSSFLEVPGEGKSRRLEVHLQGTTGWHELLEAVTTQAFELNLQAASLKVSAPALHEEYHGQWQRFEEELDGATLWHIEIPLAVQGRTVGRLQVSGFQDPEPLVGKVAVITQVMEHFAAGLGSDEVPCVPLGEPAETAEAPRNGGTLKGPHVVASRRGPR
jgi:UDP-GlcNAc:undecaprenyl-phosphate GlcNAc-1-phosphate transferase